MRDTIRRALTRTIAVKGPRGRMQQVDILPSQRLVLGIQFAIISLLCLTVLEIAHIVVVKAFSSEIFAGITLVVGTLLGAIFGQRA